MAALATQLGYPASAEQITRRLEAIAAVGGGDGGAGGGGGGGGGGEVLVAEVDGRVVGWGHVASVVSLEAEPFAELRGLVVDETVRGRGIGAQLVKAAEDWGRERGMEVLRVRTNILRERTHRFYERERYTRAKTQLVYIKRLSGGDA